MKGLITIMIFFAAIMTSSAQSLGYQDLGVLFSQNDNIGSARFIAMSGAFGALGGDISAINVNPAGISVFNNSYFSGTFNSRNSETAASYGDADYNDRKTLTSNNNFLQLSHAGAVFVFDSAYETTWSKFAIAFNYRITKDFSGNFLAEGNEAVTRFDTNPFDLNDPKTLYDYTAGQFFETNFGGEITELNIAFSAVHQKKLHVGFALNFYDLNFSQQSFLTEFNSDENGNKLDVELYQENFTTGAGISANGGFIYKAHPNFRFGLAYQTPTWYTEISQDTNYNQDSSIDFGETTFFPEGEEPLSESNNRQLIDYSIRTPGKLTASAAFIFGKKGLLSFDYSNKNYKNIKLFNGNFTPENQFFKNQLRNTHALNIGTEWRIDKFSIRGGYKFEQSPHKSPIDLNDFKQSGSVIASDNLKGYSFGGGYNFGKFKLDFAYSNNNRTSLYNTYQQFPEVDPIELQIDNRIFTTTVTINL